MIDVKLLRESRELYYDSCKARGFDASVLDKFFELDSSWIQVRKELNNLRQKKNILTSQISDILKKDEGPEGKKKVEDVKNEVKNINSSISELEASERDLITRRDENLWIIPNLIHESVPVCFGDENNAFVKTWGKAKVYSDDLEEYLNSTDNKGEYEISAKKAESHVDLVEKLDLVDLERAGKIAGSRFYFLKNRLLKLEMALINYAVDFLSERGFSIVEPPFMLNSKAMQGATDLETFSDTLYKIEGEDLYLISTAEHPIASMLSNEFLNEDELPLRVAGLSACFRKEAGSHGKDTKGIFRVHQFNKIEQFVFCKPEDSWEFLEEILQNAEQIFRNLGLAYRVVNVCSGELGRLASKKYDIEAWFPAQGRFREVVSASNDTDYQARSLLIKYRTKGGNRFVHTLNSTAIASTRTLVAIMENYQDSSGEGFRVPEVLIPYTGFDFISKS